MSNSTVLMISELADSELDVVAAGWCYSFAQIAVGNFALQIATNNQVNAAFANLGSNQGGSQSNSNNAGNIML